MNSKASFGGLFRLLREGSLEFRNGETLCLSGISTKKRMAGAAGLEPVTSAVTGQRSNQLSYAPTRGNGKLGNEAFRVNRENWKEDPGNRRQGGGGWGTPLKKRTVTRIKTLEKISLLPGAVNSQFCAFSCSSR